MSGRRARGQAATLRRSTLVCLLAAGGVAGAIAQTAPFPGDVPPGGAQPGAPVSPGAPPPAGMAPLPPTAAQPSVGSLPEGPADAARRRGVFERSVDAPYEALSANNRLIAPTAPRNFGIEGVIDARATATDRGRLDQPSGKDLVLAVSPRLSVFSRGAQLRVNAMVGVDQVNYTKNTNDDFTQPLAALDLQSEVVQNLVYFDASGSYDRRAATPFTAQGGELPADEEVKTGVVRLAPRLEHRSFSGWTAFVRSDNIWTDRSGTGLNIGGVYDDSYSQNTQFRLDKEPQRVGFGIEGGHESLNYDSADEDVIRIDNVRLSAGLAVTPQFTGWLLAGRERSRFSGETENDADYGVRLRWSILERSVLAAEVRKRFFGTGYNLQWDHRHRNYGFTLSGSREPLTEPDTVQLGGNVAQQFDAIYQSRGYTPAQRDALVRAALIAYGLPPNLTDPVSLRVNRPQLSTTYNGLVSLMGRRTVVVLSAYYRKLVALGHSDDPVLASVPGDTRQIGGQLSFNLLLSPLSTLDAYYRIDDARGLGFDLGRNSRDQVVSVGTTHSLSPKLRVNLSLQHHQLDTSDPLVSTTGSANSATLGLTYRF